MTQTLVEKMNHLLLQENPDAPLFVYHETIKQWRDEVANMNPNGGSMPLKFVRVPIAFDTPNLQVQTFPQVSADAATNSFVIAGNHAAAFGVGSGLTSDSLANAGAYTVASASFGGGQTTIVVNESVADEGADGNIVNAARGLITGAGIVAYTPTAGDILLLDESVQAVFKPTPFDGNSVAVWLFFQGATDYQNDIANATVGLGSADVPLDADGHAAQSGTFGAGGATPAVFLDATPLMLVIDDSNYGAPGSLVGEGVVILPIIPAP